MHDLYHSKSTDLIVLKNVVLNDFEFSNQNVSKNLNNHKVNYYLLVQESYYYIIYNVL